MDRRLWAGALLVAAGCKLGVVDSHFPPEQIPLPADVDGVAVAFADTRPGWEKTPFDGPVSLHRLGRVTPNAWEQLAKETAAAVATLAEKPARIDVSVVSFRLINKADRPAHVPDPSENVRVGGKRVTAMNNPSNAVEYEKLRSATAAGDAKAGTSVGTALVFQNGDPSVGLTPPAEKDDGPGTAFDEHPPGASCRVRAIVRASYPDGREKQIDIKVVAAGENISGSKYYGEALDAAAKNAVRQFGLQLGNAFTPDKR